MVADIFPPGGTTDLAATFTAGVVSRRPFLQLLGGAAGAVAAGEALAACA